MFKPLMHLDSSDAVRILNNFRHQRVLVVGDVMLDRYFWGTVTRVSPEAPVPIVARQRTSSSPGGAANVAVTVAALGGHPVLVSAAGDSPAIFRKRDRVHGIIVEAQDLVRGLGFPVARA